MAIGSGRVPDFFIVGHPKCGTSALWKMLMAHPEIFMSEVKEPRYFSSDLWSRFPPKRPAAARLHTLEGYQELFAGAGPGQLAGEATPDYLRSMVAAKAIAEVQPAAKIIAFLREPADFLRSFHLQMVSSNVETERSFERAIGLEEERRAGRKIPRDCYQPKTLLYSDHVRYAEQLQRFHAVFPPENVMVIIYDDFRKDNQATVVRVLEFLGVDPTVPVPAVQTAPNKAIRSPTMHRLANAARIARLYPEAGGPVGRAINAVAPRAVHSDAFRTGWRRLAYTTPSPPSEKFMRELRRRFKPLVVETSEYLGRDLVDLWGYGELD